MRRTATDRAAFEQSVDSRHAAGQSIVLRYAAAVAFCDDPAADAAARAYLAQHSLSEGTGIVPLLEYRGVEVSVLDETTRMATGSLKAVDGCVTTALLRASGDGRMVFESGGNTGAALTAYGQRAGLETFFFCPVENLALLDSRLFQAPTAHLIGVRDRRRVKELTAFFADRTGIRRVPLREWRLGASLFRGFFLLEQFLGGQRYDWFAQTVSAGFGPIGIYRVLEAFRRDLGPLPRFLGVQQAANAPVHRAWTGGAADADTPEDGGDPDRTLLAPVMYDPHPHTYGTLEELLEVVRRTRGEVLTVDAGEFAERMSAPQQGATLLGHLEQEGIRMASRDGSILDKTGLIALAGVLKAINQGAIGPGSRVLCALTSGASDADGRAEPEVLIDNREEVSSYVEGLGGGAGRG